ncbi:MAG: hypothetical protein LBV41_08815 [Cytophagaceae bacterium]|jgi:hypothetical protein|nr:hypothetical protein [Cytophagaceae bacterium]
MRRSVKNATDTKNSSAQSTPSGATSVSLEAFNIERDAKNHCYRFILAHWLLMQFADYCRNVQANDPHAACISILSTQITED